MWLHHIISPWICLAIWYCMTILIQFDNHMKYMGSRAYKVIKYLWWWQNNRLLTMCGFIFDHVWDYMVMVMWFTTEASAVTMLSNTWYPVKERHRCIIGTISTDGLMLNIDCIRLVSYKENAYKSNSIRYHSHIKKNQSFVSGWNTRIISWS